MGLSLEDMIVILVRTEGDFHLSPRSLDGSFLGLAHRSVCLDTDRCCYCMICKELVEEALVMEVMARGVREDQLGQAADSYKMPWKSLISNVRYLN